MKEYMITYRYNGKEYSTTWAASTREFAKAHFMMWHPGVEIISIEPKGDQR